MIASRITPRVIGMGLALHAMLWSGLCLSELSGVTTAHLARGALRAGATILAYSIAVALNLEIAAEYRSTRWLRVAWLALAANAGISILRMIVENPLLNQVWPHYTASPLFGVLQQMAIISANCCLLVGVLAMWWAYHQIGLGFAIEWRDYLAMAGILALMLGILALRANLTLAQSPYVIVRHIQQVGLILLLVVSATSIVLHRLSLQMGGGRLAAALQCLTLYALLRGTLVFVGVLRQMVWPQSNDPLWLTRYFFDLCWQLVPWVAVLAAAYRAQLTVSAAKELEHWRAVKAAATSA